ncbi:MAG TPA: hypothetical protein VGM20_05975 [Gemmatimonadales bacterium]|jgi:hypothetical protein
MAQPLQRFISRLTPVALAACASTSEQPAAPSVRQFITPAVAAQLDAAGHFVIGAPNGADGIAATHADSLAAIAAAQFGPDNAETLDAEHGGVIAFDSVADCGRTYYAQTPFAPDEVALDPAVRRAFTSWWGVSLCQDGQPALSVAVSVAANDVGIINDSITFPANGAGDEFSSIGIPVTWAGPVPRSPEDAVIAIGETTRVLIDSVPQLESPSPDRGPPQAALWRVVLVNPVTVQGTTTGLYLTTRVLYYGLTASLSGDVDSVSIAIPTGNQPTDYTATLTTGGTVTIPILPGHPVYFEAATIIR